MKQSTVDDNNLKKIHISCHAAGRRAHLKHPRAKGYSCECRRTNEHVPGYFLPKGVVRQNEGRYVQERRIEVGRQTGRRVLDARWKGAVGKYLEAVWCGVPLGRAHIVYECAFGLLADLNLFGGGMAQIVVLVTFGLV
jgi:hypothetical protein